jgi:hypothetical protein
MPVESMPEAGQNGKQEAFARSRKRMARHV